MCEAVLRTPRYVGNTIHGYGFGVDQPFTLGSRGRASHTPGELSILRRKRDSRSPRGPDRRNYDAT